MSARVRFYLVAAIASFSLVSLSFNQGYNNPFDYQIETTLAEEKSSKGDQASSPSPRNEKPESSTERTEQTNVSSNEILKQVINNQRELIRAQMRDYEYPNGKYNVNARKLEDLVIEENGKPIRSIIVTTWRSGSTFLGQIIGAHPGNFYYFEPLIEFGSGRVRGSPLDSKSLEIIRALLNCEYAGLDGYMKFGRTRSWYFNQNEQLKCSAHRDLCPEPEFHSEMCKLFPFQSMKLVRLRLSVAKELLADENLGVRMVLLVRDPRGTFQSRKQQSWCQKSLDCGDPALLCADLASDYKIARKLLKKYPTTFRVIRYEDLAAEPYERVRELYEFYGREYTENIINFLDTHTKDKKHRKTASFRNTKKVPYHWKTELRFKEIEEIQRDCAVAMEYWGYLPAMNATHQKEFNPVTDYVLN